MASTLARRLVRLQPVLSRSLHRTAVMRGMNDGDRQIGDYPNLPIESSQFKDPLRHWDKQDRREYGETVPEQDEVFGVWVFDQDPFVSKWEALGSLAVALLGVFGIAMVAKAYNPAKFNPAAPRELPFNNLYLELGGDPKQNPAEQK